MKPSRRTDDVVTSTVLERDRDHVGRASNLATHVGFVLSYCIFEEQEITVYVPMLTRALQNGVTVMTCLEDDERSGLPKVRLQKKVVDMIPVGP